MINISNVGHNVILTDLVSKSEYWLMRLWLQLLFILHIFYIVSNELTNNLF